jgi:hypothetical protein
MVDETTDVSVVEQLSLCVRYLDVDTFDVQEDFLGFVAMNEVNSESIANSIPCTLKQFGP